MQIVRRWLVFVLVVVLAFSLVGCKTGDDVGQTDSQGSAGSELSGSITILGSDTMVNLSQAWAEAFQAENSGVAVSVSGGGSGAGFAALINGTVDFANASRGIKGEETEQAEANGVKPEEIEVAKDGIAVLVNPKNSVSELSTEQLGKVYRGEVTNWKDLGGSNEQIVLLGRDTSSGTYEYFKEEVIGKELEYSTAMKNLQSSQSIVEEVSNNPAAIGYVGIGYVSDTTQVVKVDGVAASVGAVLDGSYPLSRSLFMYGDGKSSEAKTALIEWILSAAGQAIVEEQGFVPLP
ncbi:MAG: PstS family phosphate ABC transporter substrate-binding protein [Coriobacteriia bacterium]|nr:PstS family phosphate ABC transporter substrate-binding protein [Coriobacteriia bacterium]